MRPRRANGQRPWWSCLDELQARSAVRDAETMYLRNVLKKYMETEQHEALFPVIATCMHFSQAEVEEIIAGRERRMSQGTFGGRRLT